MNFAIVVAPGLADLRFPNTNVMSAEENILEQSEHWQSWNQNQPVAVRGLMMVGSTCVENLIGSLTNQGSTRRGKSTFSICRFWK